jgi:hypothetical protein
VLVCWLDDDPLAVAPRVAPVLPRAGLELAGPLLTIDPTAPFDWFTTP